MLILACGCKTGPNGVNKAALQQDELYGGGKRAHNPMAKASDDQKFRCTICSAERGKGSSEAPKGKGKKVEDQGSAKKSKKSS